MKAIVLIAGGFHLGYLGCYGNDWIDTPALDELAAGSVVFDQHFAACPEAAAARRSWRSGCHAFPSSEHLTHTAAIPDLLSLLRELGVVTYLILDGSRPHDAAFVEGWDKVKIAVADKKETALVRTLEAAQKALDRCARHENWLIWVELAPLRPFWDVPEEFRNRYFDETEEETESDVLKAWSGPLPDQIDPRDDTSFLRLQRSYAGAIAYFDAGLDMLLQDLAARELRDELLLLLTSDHSLPLGEHGNVGLSRPLLHDELVHVPLLLRLPGEAQAGRRISALTQAVDLAPTLLDAFGAPLPIMHGHSLLPLARGSVEQVRDYAVLGAQVGTEMQWALRMPDWSFLLPVVPHGTPQLYVKPDDRWEANDLVQHHLEWAESLEQTLRRFIAAARLPGPLQMPVLPQETVD